jgi:carbamoyltransferase
MEHAFLGPEYGEREIEQLLARSRLAYSRPPDLAAACAALLAKGSVLGWFQGRMEFGPRALGARSILASPLEPGMQEKLNQLKDREDFRPVAPVVLQEAAADWFEHGWRSPYMLFVDQVRADKAALIPAVCHVDGSARVQTVDSAANPALHALLRAFAGQAGAPVLVNTSFNTRGAPIVCTPEDALAAYFTSPLDALALGPFLLQKQGPWEGA